MLFYLRLKVQPLKKKNGLQDLDLAAHNLRRDVERLQEARLRRLEASGAGGQHVNKTSSAIRITHFPSGIVVQCQNERSQHRNKDIAMKMLKAQLYEREKELQKDQQKELHGDKKEIGWGSQIRSYVLQPYRLIKDHRTNCEVGNVDAVLDGNIDPFIISFD